MKFFSQQLSDNKWGIYSGEDLLATVSCADICETVLSNLASGRTEAPKSDVNELYQVPVLRAKGAKSDLSGYQPSVKQRRRPPVSKLKTKKAEKKRMLEGGKAKSMSVQKKPLKIAAAAKVQTVIAQTDLAEGA